MFRNKTLIQSASATSRAFSPLITTRRGPLTSAAFSAAQEWRRNYGSTDSNHHHHHKSSSSGPTQSSRRRAVWVFGAIVAALDIYWLSTNNNKSSTPEDGPDKNEETVHQRNHQSPPPTSKKQSPLSLPPSQEKETPAKQASGSLGLDPLPKDTTVIFVLGGPGAGKGTQCANLVDDFGFVHLSAGDLLRAEQSTPGSPYGDLIKSYIQEGKIVPMEITIALLHAAMKKNVSDRFLVDGFPRAMDQALKFEEEVCESKFVLYFECPEEEMLKRLLKRGETSGRIDDNVESIRKRFKTFTDTSFPVIEYYDQKGKVRQVSCQQSIDGVYAQTKGFFTDLFKTE